MKENTVTFDEYLVVKVMDNTVKIVNHLEQMLGAVYLESLNKNGINLFNLDGAKLYIESGKINNKSYSFNINGVEY